MPRRHEGDLPVGGFVVSPERVSRGRTHAARPARFVDMDESAFRDYTEGLSVEQAETITVLRDLVSRHAAELVEAVNEGRWLSGYIFYTAEGAMIFAVGAKAGNKTAFHMMPYYGSQALRAKHEAALSPYLTGKSCATFANSCQVPVTAIADIISRGTPRMIEMIGNR